VNGPIPFPMNLHKHLLYEVFGGVRVTRQHVGETTNLQGVLTDKLIEPDFRPAHPSCFVRLKDVFRSLRRIGDQILLQGFSSPIERPGQHFTRTLR